MSEQINEGQPLTQPEELQLAIAAEETIDDLLEANIAENIQQQATLTEAGTIEPEPVYYAVSSQDTEAVLDAIAEEKPAEQPEEAIAPPAKTPKNVNAHFATVSERQGGMPDVVNIPAESFDVMKERLDLMPNIDPTRTQNGRIWEYIFKDSIAYLPFPGSKYQERLNDPEAKFSDGVEFRGQLLTGQTPAVKDAKGTQIVEGEAALIQLAAHLGLGGIHKAALWNSGFYVYFKPPQEEDLIELNTRIASDLIELGRKSYSLAHSNHSVYTLSHVFEFALRHVYDTSVRQDEMPIANIADFIAPQDIHAFLQGFLSALYPSGFYYRRACIDDPSRCNHIEEGKLNINRALVVDDRDLNDQQRAHMTQFNRGSMTLAQVKQYQEGLIHTKNKRVVLLEGTNSEIAITLKTPMMRQYLNQGASYIESIINAVNRSMNVDARTEDRNRLINTQANAASLCQWEHFVDQIEFGKLSSSETSIRLIKDRSSVIETLKLFSSTDAIREKIKEEILSYVSRSTIAIMAIEAYNCPICNKPQEEATKVKFPQFKSYIPLDIVQVFFGLLAQKMARIETRG